MNEGQIVNSGSCAEIQDCAKGKVYELYEQDIRLLAEPYYLQHKTDRNGVKLIQILSSEKQNGGSIHEISPSVEDGYICTLKNI